jgi:hypothetical protein
MNESIITLGVLGLVAVGVIVAVVVKPYLDYRSNPQGAKDFYGYLMRGRARDEDGWS